MSQSHYLNWLYNDFISLLEIGQIQFCPCETSQTADILACFQPRKKSPILLQQTTSALFGSWTVTCMILTWFLNDTHTCSPTHAAYPNCIYIPLIDPAYQINSFTPNQCVEPVSVTSRPPLVQFYYDARLFLHLRVHIAVMRFPLTRTKEMM